MNSIDQFFGKDAQAKVPDLSWLSIEKEDVDNIPVPNNVEILPQLEQSWSHTEEKAASIVPNNAARAPLSAMKKISQDDIRGVVDTVKKAMMKGYRGDTLAQKLASLYPQDLIQASRKEFIKLASEQGLIGNVYLDISPYASCEDAARDIGPNKSRTARFIVGPYPKRVCSSHKNGFCQSFKKRVVAEVHYDSDMLKEYQDHLKIAGVIGSNDTIDSKEALRVAFMKDRTKEAVYEAPAVKTPEPLDESKVAEAMAEVTIKKAENEELYAKSARFHESRPILAFMQNEMLKGKMGSALKESLESHYTAEEISRYEPEIRRAASLQGLMGPVYVDISYYKSPQEAIHMIKKASTSPTYLIQSVKAHEFDDDLIKVAKATGCSILPKDGKIDIKIANSYLDDLQFNQKISSEKAVQLRKQVEAGDNVLGAIREAFLATRGFVKEARQGGVRGHFAQGTRAKKADRDDVKKAVGEALDAGIPLEKIEDKLSSMIPMAEAIGMVRNVLAEKDQVDAACLPKCTSEKYQFKREARLKTASKCTGCILKSCNTCTALGLRFAGAKEIDKAYLDLEISPKTEKVLYEENPDVKREDMLSEYDLTGNSGMNVTLDEMRKEADLDINIDKTLEGLDSNIQL